MNQKTNNTRSGSGLIFAVVLLFVILGMVVTLSSVTVLETKMNQKTKSSVGAFYNADSGVEWALNQIAAKNGSDRISTILSCPFTGCSVLFLGADGKVLNPAIATNTIDKVKAVRSVGTQGGETQRAIEAAVAAADLPTGAVVAFDLLLCPNGWKPADGTQGTHDLRGYFIRGLNTTVSGVDPGRTLGSTQADAFGSHAHGLNFYEINFAPGGNAGGVTDAGGSHSNTSSTGSNETRPKNVALLYCVKQ